MHRIESNQHHANGAWSGHKHRKPYTPVLGIRSPRASRAAAVKITWVNFVVTVAVLQLMPWRFTCRHERRHLPPLPSLRDKPRGSILAQAVERCTRVAVATEARHFCPKMESPGKRVFRGQG